MVEIQKDSNNGEFIRIEDMRGLKIDTNFFLKVFNGEWLVDLKHKTLEDKEVTNFRTPGVVNTGKVGVLKI